MTTPAERIQLNLADPSGDVFRQLLEAAPDAIIIADREGRITLVNRRAEEIFGYSRDELLGQPVEVLIPDRLRGNHAGHRQHYVGDLHVRPMGAGMDLAARRKDGSEFPAEISLSPIQAKGDLLITAAIRDITERKRAEQALARSNAELEQFAYVASHDLQEPLRMVSSYVQLLARRYRGKLDHDADDFINYAVDGAKRMQTLIDDLLSYSRVTRRGNPFERVDCNAVLDDVRANLSVALAETGGRIEVAPLPTVWGDRSKLVQVFQNLISNAIKFRGQAPPEVHVSAVREEEMWRFAVRDNGIGLDEKYAERIFVIFQRLHGREHYPGTGIGLAICKSIVERHGGRIWVESTPGAGAAFYFTLTERGRVSG